MMWFSFSVWLAWGGLGWISARRGHNHGHNRNGRCSSSDLSEFGWRDNAEADARRSRAAQGASPARCSGSWAYSMRPACRSRRSEEHTSELQSQSNLVCRLLLEKKKNNKIAFPHQSMYD